MIKAFLRALLKPFSFVPALMMMSLIFSFSSQDGTTSGNLSYKVSEIIVESANDAFELNWSGSEIRHYIEQIHHPVRKLAHMTEYFLLAVSVSFPSMYMGSGAYGFLCWPAASAWALPPWTNTTSPLWPDGALPKKMWPSTALVSWPGC